MNTIIQYVSKTSKDINSYLYKSRVIQCVEIPDVNNSIKSSMFLFQL